MECSQKPWHYRHHCQGILGKPERPVGPRSQEIDSVVSVIREIADQTNLLALNALPSKPHGQGIRPQLRRGRR